jgi:long-chain acyl-CoA synthetase
MLSSRNFAAFTGVLKSSKSFHFNDDDVHLSYLPLAHVFENVCVIGIFTFGGRIIAFGGDVRKLRDDLALVKPTFFMSVPRLYNRFADAIKDKFNKT